MKITIETVENGDNSYLDFSFEGGSDEEYAAGVNTLISLEIIFYFIRNCEEKYPEIVKLVKQLQKSSTPVVAARDLFKSE